MKNAIFGLTKRQDFWTEIILFSTFQVIVHPQNTVSSTDSSGSNVVQPSLKLNPRSGALYLTETGYEQLIQANSMSYNII